MARLIGRVTCLALVWLCLTSGWAAAQGPDGTLDDQAPAETQPRTIRRARQRPAPPEAAPPADTAPADIDENGWRTSERTSPADDAPRAATSSSAGGEQPLTSRHGEQPTMSCRP